MCMVKMLVALYQVCKLYGKVASIDYTMYLLLPLSYFSIFRLWHPSHYPFPFLIPRSGNRYGNEDRATVRSFAQMGSVGPPYALRSALLPSFCNKVFAAPLSSATNQLGL